MWLTMKGREEGHGQERDRGGKIDEKKATEERERREIKRGAQRTEGETV